jgi:hypothetical protein
MACTDDEYRELVVAARDAICDLLDESKHDAWTSIRAGYGDLCRYIENSEAVAGPDWDDMLRRLREINQRLGVGQTTTERDTPGGLWRAGLREWRALPPAAQEHHVLNAIGDERLSSDDIRLRVHKIKPGYCVSPAIVRRLLERGELARAKELRRPGGTAWLWVYYRPNMSAGAAALDAALNATKEA